MLKSQATFFGHMMKKKKTSTSSDNWNDGRKTAIKIIGRTNKFVKRRKSDRSTEKEPGIKMLVRSSSPTLKSTALD